MLPKRVKGALRDSDSWNERKFLNKQLKEGMPIDWDAARAYALLIEMPRVIRGKEENFKNYLDCLGSKE